MNDELCTFGKKKKECGPGKKAVIARLCDKVMGYGS